MGIVLTILKIIGIILLILLGLVIVLVSLVLFVPVRYQLQVAMDEDVNAKATVSYLFHVVHLAVTYSDKEPKGKLRILGIPVYNFFPSEEEKKKKEELERCKEEKRKKKMQKQKEKQRKKRKKNKKQSPKTGKVKKDNVIEMEAKPQKKQSNLEKTDSQKQLSTSLEKIEGNFITKIETSESSEETSEKTQGIWGKIKDMYIKAKLFLEKVVDKVKNIKYTIINFINKIKHGKKVFFWYVELLSKEESKSAIRKAKHQLGRLWKHVSPRVFQGTVQFGFEDPATTGDIFSKICMIYPLYAGHVVVIPNFEESVFKGNLLLKGRIRMAVLLHIGWKVGFDEEIRNFYEMCTNPKI